MMNEYRFNEIEIGHQEKFEKVITKEMEENFRKLTGDLNPLHRDDGFAVDIGDGKLTGHVAFGMLTASLLSTLAGMYLPGKYSLIHSIDSISFKNPVYAGDTLTVTGTVTEKQEGLNLLLLKVKMTNQARKTVTTANMKVLVLK